MEEIDAEELLARREAADTTVRIVDVRSPESFRQGHIPGSENVPMNQLPDRAAEFEGADTVVTVCPHGEASLQAARILGAYDGLPQDAVASLAGGLADWDGELASGASNSDGRDTDQEPEETAETDPPF